MSLLNEDGKPGVVERARLVPPRSQLGPVSAEQRQQVIQSSVIFGHCEKAVDRESAFERLQSRAGGKIAAQSAQGVAPPAATPAASVPDAARPSFFEKIMPAAESIFAPRVGPRGGRYDSMATTAAKSAARAIGSQVGRQIVRGVLGSMFGGSTGRRR